MSSRFFRQNKDINVWAAVNNDSLHPLLNIEKPINVALNSNNPPSVLANTKFFVYGTDTFTSALTPATLNNVYPANTSLTYIAPQTVFELSNRTFTWSNGNFPAKSNSTTYYLYCSSAEDVDSTSRGKGVYGASTNAPTYDALKGGWYSSDGLVLAMFKTDGSGNVLSTVDNFLILDQQNRGIAIYNETQASGTNGGTFTSGAYRTRTLNTGLTNSIYGCSLGSNQVTLPAGTYYIWTSAPAVKCERHKSLWYNVSDSAITLMGQCQYSATAAYYASSPSIVTGYFTITATKTFELRHRCQSTEATDGLGIASSFGDNEVYSQVIIEKVG